MNQSERAQHLGVLMIAVMVYCMGLSGCSDNPVEPQAKKDADYVAYFADLNSDNWIFGYHIISGQLDSFQVPALPQYGMAASPSGDRLYLAMKESALVVETGNPQSTITLPYASWGGVSVSPDNQFVALLGPDGVNILRVPGYSLVHHDTGWAFNGCFSLDGSEFCCVMQGNSVYTAKLDSNVTARREQRDWRWTAMQVIPSPDGSREYVYSWTSTCLWGIEVEDKAGDSLLWRHQFQPGMGEMEITPDGRHLVYTNPDDVITHCYPGDASFTVYSPTTNTSEPIQVVPDSADRDALHNVPYFVFESVEVTPDGKWIVAAYSDVVGIVNAETLEVVKYKIILGGKNLAGLAIPGSL